MSEQHKGYLKALDDLASDVYDTHALGTKACLKVLDLIEKLRQEPRLEVETCDAPEFEDLGHWWANLFGVDGRGYRCG